jgi:DNA-binding MltR family transcriptional regulator
MPITDEERGIRMSDDSELENMNLFFHEFNHESDRGAVLSAAALLDEGLRRVLDQFLADVPPKENFLSSINAPLGNFASRIDAAYCLGLISEKEFQELHTIRIIRNEFAHKWRGVNFAAQKIFDLCKKLPWRGPEPIANQAGPRGWFVFAAVMLIQDILWRERLIQNEKRTIREWGPRR